MLLYPRLALTVARFKLRQAGGHVLALARRVRGSFSAPIARSIGIATAMLALLSTLVCVTGCPPPAPTGDGTVALAWSLADDRGAPLGCDQVGARTVAVRLRDRASGSVSATAFACPNSPGTAQVAPGTYDIVFELNAADGTRLATAADQTGIAVVAGQRRQLAPITFQLSSRGTLVLSLATSATTNCQPSSAGGAGITSNTLTLAVVDGGCAAVTFTRRRGTEDRGTYTVNCSSPQITPCIEKNETLTTSLAPGRYRVSARGKVGAIDCWQRDDILEVPTAGQTLTRTLGLLRGNGPGC
jgi:hypothetical protein